jgi:hypothetical protein
MALLERWGKCAVISNEADLRKVLASSDYSAIVGTREGDWIEFHREPYQIEDGAAKLTPKGKWELRKDVASLAMRFGGCIVLGVRTDNSPELGGDVAVGISPIPRNLIDPSAYRAVLMDGLFPRVEIEMSWHSSDGSTEKGLFLISVAVQEGHRRPVIVKRMMDESGKEIRAFGIAERYGDQTNWWSAEEIHHAMRVATSPTPEAGSLPESRHALVASANFKADEAIDDLEERNEWGEQAVYVIQALPPDPRRELDDFYGLSGVASRLLNFPALRYHGFSLRGFRGTFQEGSFVADRAEDVSARLDPDGTFTAMALGDPEFLGWSINKDQRDSKPLRINSTVLVEFTLECCRFVRLSLMPEIDPMAGPWSFRVQCRRFVYRQLRLAPGPPRSFPSVPMSAEPQSDFWEKYILAEGDAGRDAFNILTRVYGLFGLGREAIPYSENDTVMEEAIRELDFIIPP